MQEAALAVDCFDDVAANRDHSGRASLPSLLKHLRTFCNPCAAHRACK